eukprot:gb/GFBE01029151.1/.p1 GENE.gb/GFBE01029151.1/~~gb/GFBE01029151.1/.p1  ORF type:complete len:731 (+),score=167.19 gb/GFBE01029151.1/:1-2193(+)
MGSALAASGGPLNQTFVPSRAPTLPASSGGSCGPRLPTWERRQQLRPAGWVTSGTAALSLAGSLHHLWGKRKARRARCNRRVVVQRAALEAAEFGLPPKLAAMASALAGLPTDRMRYQQLMALAGKLSAMPEDLKTPENKVPGCLSTVHVSASMESDGTITFQGDSDALISKGLVALLVLCLSGCTPAEIAAVKPEFIKASGITASLTPGRNNGFYNMFKLMNEKVAALMSVGEQAQSEGDSSPAPAPLQIYNTMTRSKETFETLEPGTVKMYVCGVTVYDLCHLGHARVMVFFDIVARFLRHLGYNTVFVRNVTDIDDKIIKRSNEAGEAAETLARRMEAEMQKDAASLGCIAPDFEPRVSDSMQDIRDMVGTLVDKEFAYPGKEEAASGGRDVYFRVRRFDTYGRLSRCSLDGNEAGARVEVGSSKESPEDFVLWKSAKPEEPSWESPWGPGRPGWHIECSAMAKKILGDTIDIHGGGPDLIFPHHENEIAQSEAANGKLYVKTWMHCAAVRSTGDEKMSKSLGNFVTIRDVLDRYDGEAIRFYLLSSQYRRPTLYSEDALMEANERLLKLYSSLRGAEPSGAETIGPEGCEQHQRFLAAMSNDFDTVNAVSALTDLSKELLQLQQQLGDAGTDSGMAAEFSRKARHLRAMGAVLGILQRDPEEVCRGGAVDKEFEARVEKLIQERADARKAKDFARADAIRDEIASLGVVLEDGGKGTSWRVGTTAG